MLAEDDQDQETLEELEALLYAQVYHESQAETKLEESKDFTSTSSVNLINNSAPLTVQKQRFRYFDESNRLIFYEDRNPSSIAAEPDIGTENRVENTDPNIAKSPALPYTDLVQKPTTPPIQTNFVPFLPSYTPTFVRGGANIEEILPDFVCDVIKKYRGITPDIVERFLDFRNWSFLLKSQFHSFLQGQKPKWKLCKEIRFEIRKFLKVQNRSQRMLLRVLEREQRMLTNQQVVFVSSDSESDSELATNKPVSNMPRRKKTQKLSDPEPNQDAVINAIESDTDEDEIIYIAPPPVPIVNVDSESEREDDRDGDKGNDKQCEREEKDENVNVECKDLASEAEQTKDQSTIPTQEKPSRKKKKSKSVDQDTIEEPERSSSSIQVEEETSNDFLSNDPSESQNDRFNFALHGSDFNSTDFVRPANPTELYETESSTSTSDFNKDSSRNYINSVKTIVFNEVEFPKEDIFTNNLEGFEELITTKEATITKKKKGTIKNKGKETPKSLKKVVRQKETDTESSSESDYEQTFDNLPSLSPMVKTSLPKKSKKTTPKTLKKRGNKRLSEEPLEAIEDKRSSKKKKSKPESIDAPEETEDAATPALDGTPSSKKKILDETPNSKKRRNKDLLEPQTSLVQGLINVEEAPKSPLKKLKNKRKKSGSKSNEENEEVTDNNLELEGFYKEVDNHIEEEASQVKKKKKNKKKKKQNSTLEIDNDNIINALNNSKDTSIIIEETGVVIIKDCSDLVDENADKEEPDVILIDNTPAPIEIPDSGDDSEKEDIGPPIETPDLKLANTNMPSTDQTAADPIISEVDQDFSEFDVSNLQATMSDDPNLWRVNIQDRVIDRNKKRGPRCSRCRQFGHYPTRCPNRDSQPSCQLCGEVGHEEPRCPNKICFSCGNKGSFSTVYCWRCVKFRNSECSICKCVGHIAKYCPDLWRRYHLTTSPGPLVEAKSPQLRPKTERWCAGCASQGHLDYECNSYKYIREYPAALPYIREYSCVYGEDKKPENQIQEIDVSLEEAQHENSKKDISDATPGTSKSPNNLESPDNNANTKLTITNKPILEGPNIESQEIEDGPIKSNTEGKSRPNKKVKKRNILKAITHKFETDEKKTKA